MKFRRRYLYALALFALLAVPPSSAVKSVPAERPPAFLTMWGESGGYEGQFVYPSGAAIDASNYIYVVERVGCRVNKFDSSGNFLLMWGWGVDDYTSELQVCTSGCVYGFQGSGDGQFDVPESVAVDASGNVYVADTNNHRIQKFDSNAGYVGQWGTIGAAESELSQPYGVVIDDSGDVLVADTYNHRIQKFSDTGTFLLMWGWGVDDGTAELQDCTSGCQAGIPGSGDGQLALPAGLAVDASGNVYVSNAQQPLVQKFDSSGNFLAKWGGAGTGDGEFFDALSVAVGALGNVYLTDGINNRIQKFDNSGVFLTKWGVSGSGAGQFDYPTGLAVDASGNIFVVDQNNHRIQKFGPALDFFIGEPERSRDH